MALCGAQIPWPVWIQLLEGQRLYPDVIFTDLFFVIQPDVIFMAITYRHMDPGNYLNVTLLDDSISLPCKFNLNVAILVQTCVENLHKKVHHAAMHHPEPPPTPTPTPK